MSTSPATRRFSFWRLTIILAAAAAAGFASDWFRPSQRLLFPRALPAFSPIGPDR